MGLPLHGAEIDRQIEGHYRRLYGRLVAHLIRLCDRFDVAEEIAQDTFVQARQTWLAGSIPPSPEAWLFRTARNRAIDHLRRTKRYGEKLELIGQEADAPGESATDRLAAWPDERLRLICTCCHPALGQEAQVALTLHTLLGLTTEEIARAFLVPKATMAQRLVRAKRKIQRAKIPYVIPEKSALSERLDAILSTIYLVFSEGYNSSGEGELIRRQLCRVAIDLGQVMASLLPEHGASLGLLALMLLHDARYQARYNAQGQLVRLEDQNRSLYDQAQIDAGRMLVKRSLGAATTRYGIEAAIAALHAEAPRPEETDWRQILGLYTVLEKLHPTPIVQLNRAVALAKVDGPEKALEVVQSLAAQRSLQTYHLLYALMAELQEQLGHHEQAADAWKEAQKHTQNPIEVAFLQTRAARQSQIPPRG